MLERVLVRRIERCVERWSGRQFGFTCGRDSVDAVSSVRLIVENSRMDYVLGIFVDFSSAFDMLRWDVVLELWSGRPTEGESRMSTRFCVWTLLLEPHDERSFVGYGWQRF